jgi:diaminopimelate decarboxylase
VGFVQTLKSTGIDIKYINIGGGLGITYKDETPPHPKDLSKAIQPILRQSGCTLVLEPGRALVGNAGILVTRALYHKDSGEKKFLIVDAGMNDLIRPSLYEAYHEIKPVVEADSAARTTVDVVGPICESGDFLAKDREIAEVNQGLRLLHVVELQLPAPRGRSARQRKRIFCGARARDLRRPHEGRKAPAVADRVKA